MPTIDPNLIPTVTAGTLFNRLTTDSTLNIRWITPEDPVFYESMNRPMADITVRQLVIAKTIDAINLRLSHQSNFPFLIPCKVRVATTDWPLPTSWIWDLHASLPKKWENIRLAKIKRLVGSTGGSSDPLTGTLRLIFTGSEQGSTSETSLFMQDYQIDSTLSFQRERLLVVPPTEEPDAVDAGEAETITGFIVFKTLDTSDSEIADFFEALAPSGGSVPAEYEIVDTPAGGSSEDDDFSVVQMIHGTGILVPSAWNAIPSLDSDLNTWLGAFNFPFRSTANRTSYSPIVVTIPSPLFKEFNLCAPCADEPTGDTSGAYSPVWVSKIRRMDVTSNTLKFYFATYNIKDGAESTDPIEFAALTLTRDMTPNTVVDIEIIDDLYLVSDSDQAMFRNFGGGHVVLSSLWTSDTVSDFFDIFSTVLDSPADVLFDKPSSIIGAPGALSRSPRTIPTQGQHEALQGSTERRDVQIHPSDDNRFVTEEDQGLGDEVNFNSISGITPNPDIEAIANKGALCHKCVKLIVNASGTNHTYNADILPRLLVLLGRQPVFSDCWYDGVRFKFYNGDTWIG